MRLKHFDLQDDLDTLKKKYRVLALKYHPDRNIGKEEWATKMFQEVNKEFSICFEEAKKEKRFTQDGGIGQYGNYTENGGWDVMDFMTDIWNELAKDNPKIRNPIDAYALVFSAFKNIIDNSNGSNLKKLKSGSVIQNKGIDVKNILASPTIKKKN